MTFSLLAGLLAQTASANPDLNEELDFIESTLEGPAPYGYDRSFLDSGNSASRKTPGFVHQRLVNLEETALNAGCPSLEGTAFAGRYRNGASGDFDAIDGGGMLIDGTYLNDASGLQIDGLFGGVPFGDIESDWGGTAGMGPVRKFIYGLGGDDFAAGFVVANTTRNGYVFGLQGSCPDAWEVYADWFGEPLEAPEAIPEWIHQFGSSSFDDAQSVRLADDGSIFVVGTTPGDLGGGGNAGGLDAFVRKLDPEGSPLWTHQFGTTGNESALDVAVGVDGGVFVAGRTRGNLGSPNQGVDDAFVRKLDPGGSPAWTHQLGSAGYEVATGVDRAPDGTAVVAGSTQGDLAGTGNAGGYDVFVRKLSAAGAPLWTHQLGTAGYDACTDVAVATDGAVLVVGASGGNLGGNPNQGDQDAFVQKLDSDGAVLWTQLFGTAGTELAFDVTVGDDGALIVVGATRGDLAGTGHQGLYDAFVRKLASDGTHLWTRQIGTESTDVARGVTIAGDGTIVVSGNTVGDLAGTGNNGATDIFVLRYDTDGNLLGARQLGTSDDEEVRSVAETPTGSVIVAGYTQGDLGGTGHLGSTDAFVAHLLTP